RPIIGRWLLSLLGLMAAAAVFAVVLSSSFGDVVDEAKLDQALIESALAQDDEEAGEAGGAGGDVVAAPAIGGTVKIRGTDAGVSGATIELFAADNALVPVRTAATDVDGRFSIPGLADGAYRVSVQAAGFGASWYERATSFEAATDIEVAQGDPDPDLSIELGGEPGSISGLVVGEDPSGAFVRLLIRGELIDANLDPEVAVVEVTATGIFEFPVVPAPATYEIVVTKPGFAVERRLITLQAGEARTRVEIVLQQGDGVISGQVSDGADPLGGVTVSATDGTNTFQTVSLTTPEATGSYVLRELSTPATYTITFTKPGFVSASQTITLAEGQTQEGVDITLRRAAGSISGTVSATPAGSPSAEPRGGVTVTATNGDDTFVTTTLSIGAVGTYLFENLPVPSTYTLTFSGDGLISQTRSVGVNGEETGIDAVLGAAVGVISGTVSSPTSSPGVTPVVNGPTGGVTVSLTDGVTTLETLVADDPIGRYEIDNVPPGTYSITFARPGSSPVTQLVSISPGEALPLDVVIGRQASISGLVTDEGGEPIIGAGVRLFLVEDFPTGTPIATFTTSSDGVYEFTELDAPTTYVVEFAPTPGGVGAASRTVDLGAGEQLTGIDATI
ncbi:MAG: carboxypeptidase-like regulatory domain-containing protein, partial [Acidimicrobiia bacterium]|nr:carboxypeptidase-like regulatory domain-containing protein [Acidimicrobiia bacterium]